jgi:hypothetical protein
MTDELPPDPLTALAAGAAQMHELFRAYIGSGFTEAQAMQMICAMLEAMIKKAGA